MTLITIASQKGGVGKTTLAFHLAMLGQEKGLRVLVVDLDSQGNATLALTQGNHSLLMNRDGSNLLFTDPDNLRPIETPSGVHLLHGHQFLDLADHEVQVSDTPAMADRVRALPYDLLLFDTPPAVGLRQLAPMYWADRVVVPLEPNQFAVSGLALTLNTITRVQADNRRLSYSMVINKLQNSSRQRSFAEAIALRAPVLSPHLTLRVSVEAAVDQSRPVWRHSGAPKPVRAAWLAICEALLSPTEAVHG